MALQNSFRLSQAGAMDFFKDRGAFSFPAIRLGLEIVVSEVNVDGSNQFIDAGEAAFTDDIVGELPKESLDKIEPRGAGGSEVNVDAGMFLQPSADDGMFVSGVIIDDEMEREFWRGLAMEFLEKGKPLDVRVLRSGCAEDAAVEVVQRRKERHCAVARVVMSTGADMADAQRQARLSSLQRLTLALLVAAQHERLVRRIKIKTDDIPELGFEVRIARQFERPCEVRLDLVGGPYPLHARGRYSGLTGHRPDAPAGSVRRWLSRLSNDLLLFRIRNRRLRPAPRGLFQSRQAMTRKAPLPANHRRSTRPHFGSGRLLAASFSPQQYDPRPRDHPLRCR